MTYPLADVVESKDLPHTAEPPYDLRTLWAAHVVVYLLHKHVNTREQGIHEIMGHAHDIVRAARDDLLPEQEVVIDER